ncbi:hypothetical protein CVT26_015972 [Gymnopilus dilepis]|uniref:Cytochrome P450 n=1 Tax=Gymnopilus dilepis TaxID=231916 RepID=A0A409XYJ7_9AGAR|nr:hypothetical protein CVT26_015972 [Gymnopilus dilepis]
MANLPPGAQYLLRKLPRFAIPSIITYITLSLLQKQFEPSRRIPTWVVITLAVLARPLIFLAALYYKPWADERAAAAHGAVLVPRVNLGPFSVVKELVEGVKGYPAEVILKWHKEYGTVARFDLLTGTTLITLEPEHVKALLSTQFEYFEKGRSRLVALVNSDLIWLVEPSGPIFQFMMDSLLGTGVFNADGEMWKFHRAITRPFFTRERISDFEIYTRNADLCLRQAEKRLKEGYSIDFQAKFLFGGTVGSLTAGLPYPPQHADKNETSFHDHPSTIFVKAFTQGLHQSAVRLGFGEEWPLGEFSEDKIAPLRKIMDDFAEPFMKKALDNRESKLAKNATPNEAEAGTLLAHLLINLLVAGRDTTMCLLTFCLYMLTQHPEVERRLRQEVLERVGPIGAPNYDHMRELKYTRAFLNEVLRLYPPVPLNARTNTTPIILPATGPGQKPIYVPANTGFLDERLHKYLTPNPYIFCPFNAGPRICLGQQFAYHEATFFLVRLFQQFEAFTLDVAANTPPPASWASGDGLKPREKIHPMSHLTMYVKGGLWVRMTKTHHDDMNDSLKHPRGNPHANLIAFTAADIGTSTGSQPMIASEKRYISFLYDAAGSIEPLKYLGKGAIYLMDLVFSPGHKNHALTASSAPSLAMSSNPSNKLSTVEPEHVKAILTTQFDSFEKGPLLISQIRSLLGSGVFNSDGEMWKFHRSITRQFFTRERISDFEIYHRNCERSFAAAKKRLAEGYPIDFQDLTARFTLDSTTAFLFGSSVDSLSAGIPYPPWDAERNPPSFYDHPSNKFVGAFAEGLALAAFRLGRGGEWPLAEFFQDKIRPFRKVMDDFTEPLLRDALAKQETELAENKLHLDAEEETLLAHLVKRTQDPAILKDELVNLLVAGRDSVMCLLSYSLYMLSEHPEIEKRLRQEIYDKVGSMSCPTHAHLRELKFMRAFLNEVLRLYPPVPLNFRTNKKPVVLPAVRPGEAPIYVPANTSCMYTVINIHRRTDLWGPDALEFDPDRFIDERLQKYLAPNPYIFCPFNAGPRVCLGQQFAYNEASFYLVRLLQHFTRFTLDMSANTPPPSAWAAGDGLKSREKIQPMSHLTMSIKVKSIYSNFIFMSLPPGVRYVLQAIPSFVLPSTVVYLCLKFLQHQTELKLASWLVAFLTVLAKPVSLLVNKFYTRLRDQRAAAANDAILPPTVSGNPLAVISKLVESIENGYPGDVFLEWAEEYGTVFQVDLLTNKFLHTLEPEHVKAILATQFDSFEKGPLFQSQMNSLLGTGVFNTDGDMWKFHRSITRPFFTRERISDFEIYDRTSALSLQAAKRRLAGGYSINFQDLVARFTLDSATEFLFGTSVNSIGAGIPYPPSEAGKNPASFYNHPSNVFVDAFIQGQIQAAVRTGMGAEWALTKFTRDKILPLRAVMDEFTEPLMKAALENRQKELLSGAKSADGQEETLLAHLVKNTQDPVILRDELVNLLVAGRDTTMSLLTFSIYMLTEHPDIEKRLRQEIFDKVGTTESPTYDQMRDMKYTRAFLNEVLRLYPPVPINNRTTNKPILLPPTHPGGKPIYVPANTGLTPSWMIALKFDPDRFLDERLHKYLTPNPYIFCPFNAGPRICLGQQFAYHEATFYLVRLLQNFTDFTRDERSNLAPPAKWVSASGLKATEKVYPKSHLTMYINNYMKKRTADAAGWTLAPSVPGRSLFRILRLAEAVRKGYPGDIFLQWSATLGQVYEFGIGISTLLYTNEPIHIKELLVTQFDFFEKGPLLRSQLEALLGTGVFNSDGDMWKFVHNLPLYLAFINQNRFHRIISRPFFTRKRIHDFQIYDRNCDASLKVAKERLREGYSIDFQDLVARFTLDSATEFLFGASVQSIAAGLSYPPSETAKNPSSFQLHPSNTFVKAFVEGQIQAAVRVGMGPLWPLGEIIKDKITPLRAVIDDFADPFLRAALTEHENEVQAEISDASLHQEEETLLAHLVKHTRDIRILKDEVFQVDLMSTESTLIWLALRMANKSTTLPPAKAGEKPIYVPANTTCIYAVINMHRRTDLWGPDALDFDPDRFLDERLHKYLKPNPYIFCPFNAGPRVCLGQQFAYHEATFYLVRILQSFTDFKLDDSANVRPPSEWRLGTGLKATEKIYPKCHLTMYVEGGLWISMKELQIEKD